MINEQTYYAPPHLYLKSNDEYITPNQKNILKEYSEATVLYSLTYSTSVKILHCIGTQLDTQSLC